MARNNQNLVPQARDGLKRLKQETASEVGVNIKEGYNGDIKASDAGKVGGYMVQKMIRQVEQGLQ